MNSTLTQLAPWFETWFDTPEYHQLYAGHDDHEAEDFINRLVGMLQPASDATMLDLGCGAGRHSRALAGHGFDVTGMDLSARSIHRAHWYETRSLRFRRQDMRVPFGRERYDYVMSFFTSFGYFEDEAEHEVVVRNMAEALKPEGTLVLDYLNVAVSERRLVPRESREVAGTSFQITRWSHPSHFLKRIVVDNPRSGMIETHYEKVAKFRLDDFERLLAHQGLEIESTHGDYAMGPYQPMESPRLILVARKRAAAARVAA